MRSQHPVREAAVTGLPLALIVGIGISPLSGAVALGVWTTVRGALTALLWRRQ